MTVDWYEQVPCGHCDGTGVEPDSNEACSNCGGARVELLMDQVDEDQFYERSER